MKESSDLYPSRCGASFFRMMFEVRVLSSKK